MFCALLEAVWVHDVLILEDWLRGGLRIEVAEVLFDAAAFFAVADLADLFWGEFFFFAAAFFSAGHDTA